MKAVKINIDGIDRLIELFHDNMVDLLGCEEEYEEEIEQYRKDIEYLNDLKDGVEITTMAEYVNFLLHIDELADGDYEIHNCGTLIELC